jgi:hypothetical protein
MEVLKDIFGMPLFPHLYMIPLTLVVGIWMGYQMRGAVDQEDELLPPKPKVDDDL